MRLGPRQQRAGGDVRLQDVVRRVSADRVVLDRVSVVFPAGSVVAVIGSNGAGKSTLARVVAGVDRVDSGALSRPSAAAFFVPERVPVLPGCSARSIARAFAPSLGRDRGGLLSRLDAALTRLAFTHSAETVLGRLSKGNVQKAYLAIAYALRPAVAVLDEPMTGLDPGSRVAADELLTDLARSGGVVLVTAHAAVWGADLQYRLGSGRLVPYEAAAGGPPGGDSGAPRYVVQLVLAQASHRRRWQDGLPGLPYEIAPSPGDQNALRLLVPEPALSTLLRVALDQGDAVVMVVPEVAP